MSLVRVPSLQLLKGQPFVSILQVYDAAILEAVFFEDMYLNLFHNIEIVNGLFIKAGVSVH